MKKTSNRKFLKYSTNIYGKKRVFSQDLYNKYDIPARNKIKSIFSDKIIDNPDEYGQDMIIKIDDCKYKYLELQVCSDWITPTFPRKFPYIYERKKRYGDDTLFLVFNKWLTKGLIFDTTVLVNEKPSRIKKYSREFIYEIPWNRTVLFYTKFLSNNTLKSY